MLRGISKLPPAHRLIFEAGRISITPFWDIDFRSKVGGSSGDQIQVFRDMLCETVSTHLVSDVPVGAFLSGGMGSSMIVSVATQDLQEKIKTIAVGVREQDFDELPYARMVAKHNRSLLYETCVESDVILSLPEMIWHLDEPFDPIAACQFQASQLASQHVKVVLGGDGGDELFGDFDRYFGVLYADRYSGVPRAIRHLIVGSILSRMSDNFSYKSLAQRARWFQRLADIPEAAARYAEATCFFRFSHDEKGALYGQNDYGSWIGTPITILRP